MRVGMGYDVHKLVVGHGGFDLGRSEGSAYTRAFRPFGCRCTVACDNGCILGAAALGDIGKHFPDTTRL